MAVSNETEITLRSSAVLCGLRVKSGCNAEERRGTQRTAEIERYAREQFSASHHGQRSA